MSACPLPTERNWIGDDFGRVCPLDRSKFADCDSCPHASALKAVLEDPELVLVAVPKDAEFATNKIYDSQHPNAMQFMWLWYDPGKDGD